ncbi:Two component transcriptional regulator, AraC family [Thermoclostridium stercorarium subsp. stercorarium DSM 8532]|jgi:two-component system response regulator YesN|uniref:Stage 0 sporulation protein A homolog n=3 Tax=Thermoclostridium stercorarium TaxID=1510 RepID=L7VUF0_THES1|nr:response regulator [Thermoclostridium stercorarium]AGC69198.1 Two component transcriptional regulator, AraC family [Thermoclostridium stercorarium subsp. stercorarium DSM 8532]AGI40168.1 response regulator [Thermoclostridium stercorarium subsp. stercorarium DSM 8532]ANW99474.1 AraC family transcriptional regulator [Thermoclostridium stercorarium subsp. thermolacticum DSM 2910]ANX02100.1 AraC family transcriptional regulator [Thermoclostridium stercorarium subsp. leptospartum DSM 9219]
MYKVLLVDDERIIREGIASLINWKNCGFELIGAAESGIEALHMIKTYKPEVVITDIKMPALNGLELMAEVKKDYPETIFVVLSGYGEFDYANEAMKYGVRHYLLKPCNENQIMEALSDVHSELEKKKRYNEFLRRNQEKLEKVLPLVKEQFLRDFIMDRPYTTEEMDYYCDLLKIDRKKMRLILFQLEGNYSFAEVLALSNTINEHGGNEMVYFSTIIDERVLVLVNDVSIEKIIEFINTVKIFYCYYDRREITVSYSDAVNFEDIPYAYKDALECLKYTFYLGEGIIITKNDIREDTEKGCNYELKDLIFNYDKINIAVKSGNTEEVKDEIGKFFDKLRSSKINVSVAKTYCMELYLSLIRQHRNPETEINSKGILKIGKMDTIDQIQKYITETAERLSQENYNGIIRRHNHIVKKMIKLIYENIDNNNLSLKWLAKNKLFMNEGYLGKLFNRETGEKFSQFVMRIRMEKAKELLDLYQNDKVYEVAEKVGLGDNPQYFSHVFKKYTGLTPTEYINRPKN